MGDFTFCNFDNIYLIEKQLSFLDDTFVAKYSKLFVRQVVWPTSP